MSDVLACRQSIGHVDVYATSARNGKPSHGLNKNHISLRPSLLLGLADSILNCQPE